MKYFSPNYWFNLWVLSAPLFNDETKGINAKTINNKKIQNWASKNISSLDLINQNINQESIINQPYSLLNQSNQNYLDLQNYESNLTKIENKDFYGKNKKRIKKQVTPNPQNWEISLSVPSVTQIDPDWCGPAIGESLLRHIGINPQEIINNYNRNNFGIQGLPDRNTTSVQQVLANLMHTIPPFPQSLGGGRGTTPNNWQNGISIVLRRFNRQNQINLENFIPPRYRLPIRGIPQFFLNDPGYNDEWDRQWEVLTSEVELQRRRELQQIGYRQDEEQRQELENIRNIRRYEENNPILGEPNFRDTFFQYLNSVVRNSLRNNIPVAFAQSFQPSYRAYGDHGRHFVLIDSIGPETNDLGEVRYRFMDPGNGNYQIYTAHDLYYRGGDDFYLIGSFNQVLQLQDEQIEIDYGRTILAAFMFVPFLNCNRQKRSLDLFNKNLNKKFCDLKPQIDKIQGKITAVKILDENNKGKLTAGEVYVGTTNGFYLIHSNGDVQKFNNIDEEVTNIKVFQQKLYITTKRNEIYFLRTDRLSNDGFLFVEKLWNIKSSDLDKEIKLYYNNDKSNVQINFKSDSDNYNTQFKLLNFNIINPLNYQKIEFLGDVDNNCWGTMTSFWRENKIWVYTNNCASGTGDVQKWELNGENKSIKKFLQDRNNEFHDIIENTKNQVSPNKEQILQKFKDTTISNSEIANQRFGLTWYWENDNYYLKVFTLQYCPGRKWCDIKLGNGIRLYNDDLDTEYMKNGNILGDKIDKAESENLEKELRLYYNNDKSNVKIDLNVIDITSEFDVTHNVSPGKILNLDKINPLNYQKIEFLGDVDNNCWGTMVNWGSWVYTNDCNANWGDTHKWKGKSIKKFFKDRNNEFHDIIKNSESPWENQQKLQKFKDKSGIEWLSVEQNFGLNWYWTKNNYYLQVYTWQYCDSFTTFINGYYPDCHIKLGNGIRLYNDDNNARTKRDVIDINKFEEKNVTKWTHEFTKSINHEQHLAIDNKPNFSTINITTL